MYGTQTLECPGVRSEPMYFPGENFNRLEKYQPIVELDTETQMERLFPRIKKIMITMPQRANIFCRTYETACMIVRTAFNPMYTFMVTGHKIAKDSAEWEGCITHEDGRLEYWTFKWRNTCNARGVKGDFAYIEARIANFEEIDHISMNHREVVTF